MFPFFSSLITIENGEEPVKKSNGIVEGVSFDQILDLDTLPDSNKAETEGLVGLPTPIIAFEESITQQNNTAGNDDPSYPSEILCRGEMPYKGARHGSGSTTMEELIFTNSFLENVFILLFFRSAVLISR